MDIKVMSGEKKEVFAKITVGPHNKNKRSSMIRNAQICCLLLRVVQFFELQDLH